MVKNVLEQNVSSFAAGSIVFCPKTGLWIGLKYFFVNSAFYCLICLANEKSDYEMM